MWFLENCALSSLLQSGRAVVFAAAMTLFATLRVTAWAAVPEGVWLIDAKAAVQIFDCEACCVAEFFGCRFRAILRGN